MKFNVRSALAAVGQLAEGRLVGQIEAQQEQEQRSAAEFQRSLALTQLDLGQQDALDTSSSNALRYADPSAVGGPISAMLKSQAERQPPSERVIGGLSPRAQRSLNLHPSPNGQPMPVGGQPSPAVLPPVANPTQGAISPSSPGSPNPPAPAFPGVGEMMLSMMSRYVPMGMGAQIQQSLFGGGQPPVAQTQPPGQPPPATFSPSGTGTGAQPPVQGSLLGLRGQVQQNLFPAPPAAPVPQSNVVAPAAPPNTTPPAEAAPTGIRFPQDPEHEVPVAGAKDSQVRPIFDRMHRVAGDLARVELKDNPHAAAIVAQLRSLPGYDSGRTPEGRAAMQEATSNMLALLAGAQKVGTPGQEAAGKNADTRENQVKHANLDRLLTRTSARASAEDLRVLVKQVGLEEEFGPLSDQQLVTQLLGAAIDKEKGTIEGRLANTSNMSEGEVASLVGTLNGLKGRMPGGVTIPMSQYNKLTPTQREKLLATATVRVDRHAAAGDAHRRAVIELERAQVSIDEGRQRIINMRDAHQDKLLAQSGKTVISELRSRRDDLIVARRDLAGWAKAHPYAEPETRDYIEATFGKWLDQNDPVIPKYVIPDSLGWDDENKAFIQKLLVVHQRTALRDLKEAEFGRVYGAGARDTGGTVSGPAAPARVPASAAAGPALSWLPKGWNQNTARTAYAAYTNKYKKSPAASRKFILDHAEIFGPGH